MQQAPPGIEPGNFPIVALCPESEATNTESLSHRENENCTRKQVNQKLSRAARAVRQELHTVDMLLHTVLKTRF